MRSTSGFCRPIVISPTVSDRFRAGADTLNISLAARPQLGALQKHRPSANESVRASHAAGDGAETRDAFAGLTAEEKSEPRTATDGSLRRSYKARHVLATAAGLDPATLSFEG